MSALPPTASAIPGLAAVAAKVLSSGNEVDAASSQISGLDQFAAHFQLLLGKQLVIEVDASQLPVSPEKTVDGADAADELAALLPFIEALGLTQGGAIPTLLPCGTMIEPTEQTLATETATDATINLLALSKAKGLTQAGAVPTSQPIATTTEPTEQTLATKTVTDATINLLALSKAKGLTQADAVLTSQQTVTTTGAPEQTLPTETATDTAVTLLAAPMTISIAGIIPVAPAISAANPSPQGQTHGLAFNVLAQPAGTGETAETLPNAIPGNGGPAEALSAGREFSSRLVEAIAVGKETQHSPGTTAVAVQNIVSQAAPGRVMGQEAAPIISQAVGSPGWTEEVGNRVAWLANRSESKAELVLTPPQMGRIEVSLSVKGDQATASFVSSNPVVREALEAALPRLREVLADAGIQLGQAQVSAENARQWAQQEKHGDNSASDQNRGNPENAAISRVSSGSLSTGTVLKTGRGFVDVFA